MKRVFSYLSKYKKEAMLAPLFKMLEATFELLVPLVVKRLVDTGIKNADKPYIAAMCAILVVFCIVGLPERRHRTVFFRKSGRRRGQKPSP